MLNFRIGMRGIALISLLAGGALLKAQVETPHIDSLASSLVTDGCLGATHGAGYTVNSPGAGNLCLYVNGSFASGAGEAVTWTDPINGTVSLDLGSGSTTTQVAAIVPQSLLFTAVTATIQVIETPAGSEFHNPSNAATF